jgi:spermidine synthase
MLYVNSRPQASDAYGAAQLHQLLGHFPMLLHRAPRDVLVVGLGGGATPGAVALHRDVRVDVVELVPNVIRAAPQLSHINGDVLNRPNVRIIEDDGRNFLLRAVHGGRRYDVITADIIRPHHAGAGNLYSVEYYRLAAAALKEDGIMMQWFDPSPMHRHQLLLRTFMEAFPYTSLWLNGDLVIGSKQPLALTPERLVQRARESGVPAETLAALAIPQGHELVGHWFLARDDELRSYTGPGPILSDDRPAVEYFRSLPDAEVGLDLRRFSRRN